MHLHLTETLIPNPQRRTRLLVRNLRTCEQTNRKRRHVTGAQCFGGIDGVQASSLDVCCTAACGTCGGSGCTPANTSSLTANDCCATEILDAGVLCSETGTAPCILSTGEIYRLEVRRRTRIFFFCFLCSLVYRPCVAAHRPKHAAPRRIVGSKITTSFCWNVISVWFGS